MKQRILIAFVLFVVPVASAQVYRVTDLGTLPGGSFSEAAGVNDLGQVVGRSEVLNSFSNLVTHAFLWRKNGGMQDLGTLPALKGFDYEEPYFLSSATALNFFGLVVGSSWVTPESDAAFLWSKNGGMQDLGHLVFPNSGWSSYAQSINLFGQVVGISSQVNGFPDFGHAFLWTSAAGMEALGALPGDCYSYAYGINDLGQVVGVSQGCPLTSFHAFLWRKGVGMVNLGAWTPAAINNLGTAVGDNGSHAVTWNRHKGLRDLGTLPGGTTSSGIAINDFGQVVGSSNSSADPYTSHATLWWNSISSPWDLNSLIAPNSGWVLYSATGINILGQVVGYGTINGQEHAFLLTPNL
jgi:probable HAF family extracellular repeat protein